MSFRLEFTAKTGEKGPGREGAASCERASQGGGAAVLRRTWRTRLSTRCVPACLARWRTACFAVTRCPRERTHGRARSLARTHALLAPEQGGCRPLLDRGGGGRGPAVGSMWRLCDSNAAPRRQQHGVPAEACRALRALSSLRSGNVMLGAPEALILNLNLMVSRC